MSHFEGLVIVERVLSQLEGGCIFRGRMEDGRSLRVKFAGKDTQPLPGDWYMVAGSLGSFKDGYGRVVEQVDSKKMTRAGATGALLKPWLERMPNIGATRAARMVDAFGQGLPEVLSDIDRLSEVAAVLEPGKPSLAIKIASQLYAKVAAASGGEAVKAAEAAFLAFLEKLGIRESRVASQMWRFLAGVDAIDRLRRNPYLVASLVDWSLADRVGKRLLRHADPQADLVGHPARLIGALSSVWREILAEGNTAATVEQVEKLLEARGVPANATLSLAEEAGVLRRAGRLLRAPGAAWLEDQVVSALRSIELREPTVRVPEGDALARLVYDAENNVGMHLTDEQRFAVAAVLNHPVAALQGGAGVGKTTVMKVLAQAWEYLGGNVVMGALAGKAALTLARGASTHARPRLAYTIARLIGMLERQHANEDDPERKRPEGDVTFTPKTLLVIDEAGMLDTPSLHKLLSLLPEGARVLFAGDQGQLPPVGIGKFFHDLVDQGSRVSMLTKVLRQASDSAIPHVAALIRSGAMPMLELWRGERKGVYLVSMSELLTTQRRLRDSGELLVVAAKKSTVFDINDSEAHHRRTPGTAVRRLGPMARVAVGDPVVVTVNRYQEGLFNGLLGVVRSIDGAEITVLWDGESSPRTLPLEAEGDIELAYAITCHKAQGSSSDAVLVAVEDVAMVTREWLYTALTRGKELVLLACDEVRLGQAIQRRTERLTGMQLPPCGSMVRATP